jgi:hypothetical protein
MHLWITICGLYFGALAMLLLFFAAAASVSERADRQTEAVIRQLLQRFNDHPFSNHQFNDHREAA